MKNTLQVASAALFLAASAAETAVAADAPAPSLIPGLTANAQLTTNYILRGISQTANRPALQGGLDYDTGLGFTFGTWLSSINFGDHSPLEWDVYGAYNFKLGNVNASVGGIGYIYPYAGNLGGYDYFELTVSGNYDFGFAVWNFKGYGAPFHLPPGFFDIKGVHPTNEYFLYTGLTVPVAPWLALSGNVGYEGYTGVGTSDYVLWDLGATLTYDKYALDLRYIDTSEHIPRAVLATTTALTGAPNFATGPYFIATFKFTFP